MTNVYVVMSSLGYGECTEVHGVFIDKVSAEKYMAELRNDKNMPTESIVWVVERPFFGRD